MKKKESVFLHWRVDHPEKYSKEDNGPDLQVEGQDIPLARKTGWGPRRKGGWGNSYDPLKKRPWVGVQNQWLGTGELKDVKGKENPE